MITAQHGVYLTADDAAYLSEFLDHVCRDMRPSAKLVDFARRLKKSCAALTPTQENGRNRLRAVHSEAEVSNMAAYDLVDTDEAARLLKTSAANVRDLVRRGRLPAQRVGNRWLLPARVVVERAERQAARRAG
ncbi:DNA binding, excisionase family domain protein [Mycobacterium kansasii 732]|nr:DNA binding, excisionase family domain protein [Mycobacterium kansasii 732]